jgi:nucleoside-diphosphate-sugar epimerase
MHIFFFGYGYVAQQLVSYCRQNNITAKFTGTKRDAFKDPDVDIILWDELIKIPGDVTHILISIPPNENGDPVYQRFAQHLLKLNKLEWVGYCSSTAVYGDYEGEWVNEESELKPTSERGIRRKQSEEQWLYLYKENKIPVHIWRLSAIYGPGRNELIKLQQGKSHYIKDKKQCFSRIHVIDICRILLKSMQRPTPGEVYNLSDDLPSPHYEVVEYAAKLLKIPLPPSLSYEDIDENHMLSSFYRNRKKVLNLKIKASLDLELLYPNFRNGLDNF